jgi:hypothetical protein
VDGLSTVDKCENCGREIGKLETAHLWQEHVLCGECYKRLSGGQAVDAAFSSTTPIGRGQSPPRRFRVPLRATATVAMVLFLLAAVACLWLPGYLQYRRDLDAFHEKLARVEAEWENKQAVDADLVDAKILSDRILKWSPRANADPKIHPLFEANFAFTMANFWRGQSKSGVLESGHSSAGNIRPRR